ncbi:MAG: FAD-dependent oxidoreductase [Candidatus Hydrogenedentes bacterium]|nr:FAD-dependent oxidoreductase [Candidatus Hydrogenedentota bacterium]
MKTECQIDCGTQGIYFGCCTTLELSMNDQKADLIIIGGGVGGCAAAIAAARMGRSVIMTEETDWIGGQLTSQAVPPDENKWIETHGGTKTYQDYRSRVRDYYRRNYPLTDEARANEKLNPGGGGVSALCHEPRVSVAVLNEMLAPYISNGRVIILLEHKAIAADTEGDRVRNVTVHDIRNNAQRTLHGAYFIDATECGDLLPLTKTEYVTGAEGKSDTDELHAPDAAQPQNMQAFTCCFAMEFCPGEDHTIHKPEDYTFWRDYVPQLRPPWTGHLLSWEDTHPVTLQPRLSKFDPAATKRADMGRWNYRRIQAPENFMPGFCKGGITLVNWPQNDYWLGNLYEVSAEESAKHLRSGKQLSLSLLYWLQTEAPRADGSTGWKELRLRPDHMGTADGLAKYPYIRESRRIKAEFTVLEHHVGKAARQIFTGENCEECKAEFFPDSVGIGYYRIDLHPSSGGDNYIDVDSMPFQIPLGALIPKRVENLLPACKNLGTTHITNGCYRLHPVEWNIGESAGVLAAWCIDKNQSPRAVRANAESLTAFQRMLESFGVRLSWPA